ncbi:TetR/AcrR family transcriptional regulator [Gottschalkiaceae bacterium SANA]|nr:TetR/AcrR family transcriptional regulator [Gottschalkiaceae bacterium SANA]
MAKRREGVYERIQECAMKEFLAHGFKDASLRRIATNAETATGSIYTRFKDKGGLFDSLVAESYEAFKTHFDHEETLFFAAEKYRNIERMMEFSNEVMEKNLDMIYQYPREFKLLITCSAGTKYENIIDEFVDYEVESTKKFLEVIGNKRYLAGEISDEFLHIISNSYLNGFFEIIRHDMPEEKGRKYLMDFGKFYGCGFSCFMKNEIS